MAGLALGWNAAAVHTNFSHMFRLGAFDPALGVPAAGIFGLVVAISVAQSGSLFAADAWHDITMVAGEVRNPKRNLPLALALGCSAVVGLYLLVNLAYLAVLSFPEIQHAPSDRVATAMLEKLFPGYGPVLMAAAIMISTFGCVNSLVLAGARAYYAMAKDGLFFAPAGVLNRAHVPAWGLVAQGIWAAVLVLPRTYNPATQHYGNLYSNLARLGDFGGAAVLYPDHRRRVPAAAHAARCGAALPCVGLSGAAGSVHWGRIGSAADLVRVPAGNDVAGDGDRDFGRGGVWGAEVCSQDAPSAIKFNYERPGLSETPAMLVLQEDRIRSKADILARRQLLHPRRCICDRCVARCIAALAGLPQA